MAERLILEAITPEPGSFDVRMMAAGKPGLPGRFTWRGTTYTVETVLDTWKETGEDRGDVYVRRHGFEIRTTCGVRMKLVGERRPRGRAPRWTLRAIDETA
ncbi:MAG: DUF6504 family protein [Planctomycetota bacterium]|nr:DUF6504 family protein [Planctomycetota bacterium]